ncbi:MULTISPECIES: hypothetical protein [Paenibacillus]|uniref:hypothetical protein n=1 Tax=Paenibacillus TaxID=44249 RepID=UPI0008FC8533|nr:MULTISPECIES: hypothetical protein [Paenibacillus]OMF49369.1 hypothetical protein BK135_08810 [Paenibacillus peoriae]
MGFDDSDGHCIGTKDIHPQLKAHAPVVTLATSVRGKSIYISQNDSDFIIASREALPYWLQQYAALQREYERFQQVAKGWNDDLITAEERHAAADRDRAGAYKALEQAERRKRIEEEKNEILKNNIKVISDNLIQVESLIQQKDAEIYHLKKSIEALLMHKGSQVHDEPDLTHVTWTSVRRHPMIRAYTSILCALLLFIGVVQVDRYMLIETVPASEVRIKYK